MMVKLKIGCQQMDKHAVLKSYSVDFLIRSNVTEPLILKPKPLCCSRSLKIQAYWSQLGGSIKLEKDECSY